MFSFMISFLFINTCFAQWDYALENYLMLQHRELSEEVIASGNQFLKIPNQELSLDLRLNLKHRAEDDDLFVLRPRVEYRLKNIELNSIRENEQSSKADISDLFYENNLTQNLSTTVGLQVYQWGPAEFINPTNPLYHFNYSQKNIYYKEKGQFLLRANYSFNRDTNVIVILQPISNNESLWLAEDKFTSKTLIKFEKIIENTANLFGFVVGKEEKQNSFIGHYFNWQLLDSTAFYADIKLAENQINYFPVVNNTFVDIVGSEFSSRHWLQLSVFGLRWEGEADVRVEYIYNQAGLNSIDLENINLSTTQIFNPNYLRNINRIEKMGLELLGQHYLYSSLRVNEPFSLRDFNFYSRYLLSGQDNSGQIQIELDRLFYDEYLGFVNYSVTSGATGAEFKKYNNSQFVVGVKWGY